jgi:hypothetical protein
MKSKYEPPKLVDLTTGQTAHGACYPGSSTSGAVPAVWPPVVAPGLAFLRPAVVGPAMGFPAVQDPQTVPTRMAAAMGRLIRAHATMELKALEPAVAGSGLGRECAGLARVLNDDA